MAGRGYYLPKNLARSARVDYNLQENLRCAGSVKELLLGVVRYAKICSRATRAWTIIFKQNLALRAYKLNESGRGYYLRKNLARCARVDDNL